MKDNVESPAHYTRGDIECIDAVKAMLTEQEFKAHCRATAMGYIWRAPFKNNEKEDLHKAIWFLYMAAGDDPRERSITKKSDV